VITFYELDSASDEQLNQGAFPHNGANGYNESHNPPNEFQSSNYCRRLFDPTQSSADFLNTALQIAASIVRPDFRPGSWRLGQRGGNTHWRRHKTMYDAHGHNRQPGVCYSMLQDGHLLVAPGLPTPITDDHNFVRGSCAGYR